MSINIIHCCLQNLSSDIVVTLQWRMWPLEALNLRSDVVVFSFIFCTFFDTMCYSFRLCLLGNIHFHLRETLMFFDIDIVSLSSIRFCLRLMCSNCCSGRDIAKRSIISFTHRICLMRLSYIIVLILPQFM